MEVNVVIDRNIELEDGRTLHVYDCADDVPDAFPVVWNHGTPNLGLPPEPLFPAARDLGVRWVSYDRPAYGGSTPAPERTVASAAADVNAIADALDIEQFAVMGHSSGATCALACAALLPHRVLAAVCVSGLAPFDAPGLNWFAGIGPSGSAELHAAAQGPDALAALLAVSEFDPEQFTPADYKALEGPWGWLGMIAGQALKGGYEGFIEDDVATVRPWGFEPEQTQPPMLLVHGTADRMVPSSHSEWLARHIPNAELWLRPGDGHISVLSAADDALAWLMRSVR